MEIIKLNCPNCGGTLDITGELEIFYCQYCGSKILVKRDASAIQLELLDKKVARAEALPVLKRVQVLFNEYKTLMRQMESLDYFSNDYNKKVSKLEEKLSPIIDEIESYEQSLKELLKSKNKRIAQAAANAYAGIIVWDLEIKKRKFKGKGGISPTIIALFGSGIICFILIAVLINNWLDLNYNIAFLGSLIITVPIFSFVAKVLKPLEEQYDSKKNVPAELLEKIERFKLARNKFLNTELTSYLNETDDEKHTADASTIVFKSTADADIDEILNEYYYETERGTSSQKLTIANNSTKPSKDDPTLVLNRGETFSGKVISIESDGLKIKLLPEKARELLSQNFGSELQQKLLDDFLIGFCPFSRMHESYFENSNVKLKISDSVQAKVIAFSKVGEKNVPILSMKDSRFINLK